MEKCGYDGVVEVCIVDMCVGVGERSGENGEKRKENLQPCTSGKREIMLRNRPGSASVRYALKVPSTPIRRNAA